MEQRSHLLLEGIDIIPINMKVKNNMYVHVI